MHELVPKIDEVLMTKTRDEWGEIFDKAGLIWGPVLGLHEVAQDSQADAINLFPEVQHETLGTYKTVNIPMRFADAEVRPRAVAPLLGEHTHEALKSAGYSDEELASLTEAGVINLNS